MELEADAEAALLVCPRSPALASANQKFREGMSNSRTPQRGKHIASTADCELCGLPSCVWNVVLSVANALKFDFFLLRAKSMHWPGAGAG